MSKSQAKTRKKTRPTRPAGAQLGARGPAFTAGATGGKLLPRIRRLLGADRPGPLSLGRCLSGVLALVTIIAIAIAVGVSCSLAEPSAELANTPATQAAEKAEKERISALIEQLGSSKFEERRAAQQALVGIGPAALPALRAASQGDDSERSIRAKQALESIQRYERIPDTVSQVLLKTHTLGKRAPIASPHGLGAEEFLEDIATDDRIAELLQIAAKGSSAERSRMKKAVIAAMRKYVDDLPETIGPDEPWRPNVRNAPGVFVCAYLLSSFDEQPAEMLDLLAQVLLRNQTAMAARYNGRLHDFVCTQDKLLLAMACCHYLDLCQRDLGRKGALNAGQTKAIKEYAALKDSLAGKGTAAEIEQVAVLRVAAACALAGGNERVRKLHDRWLAATAPARQKGEKLKAILPSGTEIELVAVSDYPDKNHPWWRPGGIQLDVLPIDPSDMDITSYIDPKLRKIELVFRLGGKADQPAYESQIRRSDGGGVWWAGRRTRSGKVASDFKVVATDVPVDSKAIWMDLLVAAGPWETIATCDGRQAKGPLSAATPGGRASSGPSTLITARFDPDSKEARVIGIDANGVKHIIRGFDIRNDGANSGADFLFQGLKPEQFKSFTLQTRPNNELIHLMDISLKPGHLTRAQLISAPPTTLPAPVAGSGPAPAAGSGQAGNGAADKARVVRRVYNVQDLIVAIPSYAGGPEYWDEFDPNTGSMRPARPGDSERAKAEKRAAEKKNQDDLVDQVKRIDPGSWKGEGREDEKGMVQVLDGALVISQTPANQAWIGKLIDDLRSRRLQVRVTIRFIRNSEIPAGAKGDDLPAWLSKNAKATLDEKTGLLRMSDSEAEALRKHIESKADYRLLDTPLLTLHNGKRAYVTRLRTEAIFLPRLDKKGEKALMQIPIGVSVDVKPVVDADRKSIVCDLATWIAERAFQGDVPGVAVAEAKAAFTVPDKGTMLLRVELVKHKIEGARQAAAPAGAAKMEVRHSPVETGRQEKNFAYILISPRIIENAKAATQPAFDGPMYMPPATQPATQPAPNGASTQPAPSASSGQIPNGPSTQPAAPVRAEVQGKPPTKYVYHQVAVWTFDKKTHALVGFAKGEVAPGGRVVLESVKGHAITFTLGRVKKEQVSDEPGGKRRLEPMVEFKIAHGTGSSQGSLALDEPKFSVEYGLGEPVASVVAMIPVGSLPAKAAAAIPARLNLPGRPEELDDVLLGSASVGLLSVREVVEVYGIVGRTTRPRQWRQIMADKDADIATVGATVLARVGDDAGTRRFCKLCLQSRGNEQVWLVEQIPQMPPSAAMLDAMVQLIMADRTYMEQWGPDVGVADMDRRFGLLEVLFAKYTPQQVKPHAPRLIAWAKGWKDAALPRKIEQFINAPEPATGPASSALSTGSGRASSGQATQPAPSALSTGSGRASSGQATQPVTHRADSVAPAGARGENLGCPLEVTIYEVRLSPEKASRLDAGALTSAAASPTDLEKILAGVGQVRMLYRMDQSVKLSGDRIMIVDRVPAVTASRRTETGSTLNTVQYLSVGAVLDIAGAAAGDGIDAQLGLEVSAMTGSQAKAATQPASVVRQARMSYKGLVRPGKAIVILSANAGTPDAEGRAVAYVGRIVLGAPQAAAKPAAQAQSPACPLEATIHELHLPPERMGSLDAAALRSAAAGPASLEKALAGLGQAKVLYRMDQSVKLSGDRVMINAEVPTVVGIRHIKTGQSIRMMQNHAVGAILNVAGTPQPDGGVSADLGLELSALTDSAVEIGPQLPARVVRKIVMAYKGPTKPGVPIVIVSADAVSPDASGKAVAYVARVVLGKPVAATQPATPPAPSALSTGSGRAGSGQAPNGASTRPAAQGILVLVRPNPNTSESCGCALVK